MMFARSVPLSMLGSMLICIGCGDNSGEATSHVSSVNNPSGISSELTSPASQTKGNEEETIHNSANALPSLQHGRIKNAAIHESVRSPFRLGTASIEVLGVCSYEGAIQCTDAGGKRSKECEQKLAAFLDRRLKVYGDDAVPYRIGLKNRVLIFRARHVPGPHEPNWITFGGPPLNGSYAEPLTRLPRLEQVREAEAVTFFAVPPDSKFGSVAALLRQPFRTSKGFKLAPSESVDVERHQLKVLSVEKDGNQWAVRFELTKTHPSELALQLRLNGADDRLIEFVDRSGKPVNEAERRELLEKYAQHPTAEAERPVVPTKAIDLIREKGNVFRAKIPVDPQYVREATLSGEMRILYNIERIPLAPAKP